ncbi:MAG: AsmA-like C-terminal region-containing protein [Terracidiphilus sp.]
MTENRDSFWRRHRWVKWFAGSVLVLLIALGVAVSIVLRRTEPFLRAHIVEALEDRFHARVELDSFHVSLAHGLQAQGRGLRIWPPAQVHGVTVSPSADASDPLIRLDEFRFHAPLRFQPGKPFHIGVVELKGLDIHVPPKSHFGHAAGDANTSATPAVARLIAFAVDRIECTSAHFVLETNKPNKLPLDFAIARLTLVDVTGGPIRAGSVMHFEADLTNPRPVGIIHSTGSFGPWNDADPGESPIQGAYQFDHADLASFKGIAGILSSTGKYQGTLRDLIVDGDTDTPDFQLTHFGNAMPLHTHFHARVDATNGDTWLEPVDAVLDHSHFTAQGQVVRVIVPDPNTGQLTSKGHDIALNVNIDQARIEDFLRLASHNSTPLLTGSLTMKAALHIPPGLEPVHKRLALKGVFNLDQVRFTSEKIQGGITNLSLRGQGLPHQVKGADPNAVRSTMQGNFQMAAAVITLPSLTYTVPGADIQLKGSYGVEGGELDFTGTARLNATVSQMVGGVLGALLKPADRIFKRDGAGTELPIRITGTREDPMFGVEIDRLRRKSMAAPAENP